MTVGQLIRILEEWPKEEEVSCCVGDGPTAIVRSVAVKHYVRDQVRGPSDKPPSLELVSITIHGVVEDAENKKEVRVGPRWER